MKITRYSLSFLAFVFLFFCTFCSAQSTLSKDSLSLSWERLDGPAAYVAQYTQQGNMIFAASEEALFSSLDGGLHWFYNSAFGQKRIRQLFANASVVLVIAEEPVNLDPGFSFPSFNQHQVYRSIDRGLSWQKVLDLVQYPEIAGANEAFEIVAKNDSVLGFNYRQYLEGFTYHFDFYESVDLGNTWKAPYLNGVYFEGRNDTISFTTNMPNGNTPEGRVTQANDLSLYQSISFTGTNATWANIFKTAYKNGVYFIFLRDKTLWRSEDAGQNWQSGTLPITDDLKDVVWADSVFFYRTYNKIYRANAGSPLALSTVYSSLPPALEIRSFTPLPSGYWLNNALNQTLFSPDKGQSWMPRAAGLSSRVGEMRAECGALRAKSLGNSMYSGGWYFSNQDDADWTLNPATINCCLMGTFGGYLFRYDPARVQRSADCGATWQDLPIVVTAQPYGLVEHKGRLYLFTALDIVLHYSDDYGDTWQVGENADFGIYQMFSVGDNLISIGNSKVYRSTDDAQSWEENNLPYTITDFSLQGNYLVGLDNGDNGPEVNLYRSADLGKTWERTVHFTPDTCGWLSVFTAKIKAVTDSLVFVNHDTGLYVSGNQGQNWTRISQLPFTKRYNTYCANYVQDTFIGQVERLFFDSGFVYAASESQGLWRTPVQSIYDYLFQVSSLRESPKMQDRLAIFPNPAHAEIMVSTPSGFDVSGSAKLKIFASDGKLWLDTSFQGASLEKDLRMSTGNWPSGIYFIMVQTDNQVLQGQFAKH